MFKDLKKQVQDNFQKMVQGKSLEEINKMIAELQEAE